MCTPTPWLSHLRSLVLIFHGHPRNICVSDCLPEYHYRTSDIQVLTAYFATDSLFSPQNHSTSAICKLPRRPARKSIACVFQTFPIFVGLDQRGVSGSPFILLFSGLDFPFSTNPFSSSSCQPACFSYLVTRPRFPRIAVALPLDWVVGQSGYIPLFTVVAVTLVHRTHLAFHLGHDVAV